MKRSGCVALLFCLFLGSPAVRGQALEPEAERAVSMVKGALEFWEKNGQAAAIDQINARNPLFSSGNYYVFVYDYSKPGTATCLARADGDATARGVDRWGQTDPDGKLYIQEMVRIAQSPEGKGWVDYKRMDPVSQKIEPKSSYVEKIKGASIFVGCGYYK